MKRWVRKDEFMSYALCGDSPDGRYIEPPDTRQLACSHCPVWSDCAEWAIREDVHGVVSAGVWIPETSLDELDTPEYNEQAERFRLAQLDILRSMLDNEIMIRGEI